MDQRDLLIKNGKILCMDGGRCADWLLTHDGKVSRLGVGACRSEYISGTVQTIDAKGRTVLPGFIDNHFEVVRLGLARKASTWGLPEPFSATAVTDSSQGASAR